MAEYYIRSRILANLLVLWSGVVGASVRYPNLQKSTRWSFYTLRA
jgi:hypothetical protein